MDEEKKKELQLLIAEMIFQQGLPPLADKDFIMKRYGYGDNNARLVLQKVRLTHGGGKLGKPGEVLMSELLEWELTPEINIIKRLPTVTGGRKVSG